MIRLLFLILIFSLWFKEKITIWAIVLITGLVLTPILGRVYYGWACPVFTTLDIFAPLPKKPLLEKFTRFLDNKLLQGFLFIIFLVAFIFMRKVDFVVPFFILLIPLGLLISILFGTAKWHRICPFGIIFSFSARLAKYGYSFNAHDCSKCRLCARDCENACLHFVGI